MEKYGRYRDARTGIYPFVPFQAAQRPKPIYLSILLFLKRYILAPPLAIVRLILSTIIFGWMLIMSLFSLLIPIPIIRRLFRRYTQFLGARSLLFLLGFFHISTRSTTIKKSKKLTVDAAPSFMSGDIGHGDIIICNHISYVDILYLLFRFSPVFTAAVLDDPPKVLEQVAEVSFLRSMYISATSHLVPSDRSEPLLKICHRARKGRWGPVVVFPEATTSCGSCLLQFHPVIQSIPPDIAVHLLGFEYSFSEFSPALTVGSFFAHVFRLACQFHNTLAVKYVDRGDLPEPLPITPPHSDAGVTMSVKNSEKDKQSDSESEPESGSEDEDASDEDDQDHSDDDDEEEEEEEEEEILSVAQREAREWATATSEVLATALRLKVAKMGLVEKQAFSDQWYATQKKRYVKSKTS